MHANRAEAGKDRKCTGTPEVCRLFPGAQLWLSAETRPSASAFKGSDLRIRVTVILVR